MSNGRAADRERRYVTGDESSTATAQVIRALRDAQVTRPIVAISATARQMEGSRRVRLNEVYVRAVEGAGMIPLLVPPFTDPADATRLVDAISGVVLTGGEDVDPSSYGAAPHFTLGATNALRDATEIALTLAARDRGTPTLAICRGIQIANVALGGTLVQDIPTERPGSLDHERKGEREARVHEVTVAPGSLLARALGTRRLTVNSFHHQALDRVADGVRVTATASDGIIEGAESADARWWMLGVQWHPEELTETPEPWDRGLFLAFADAIQDRRATRAST